MANHQITCITKPHPQSPHEHITHIGGAGWKITREEAIRQIESGANTFYVKDSRTGRIATVAVVREAGKIPFLRTHADGFWNDNLLSLPQCY